MKYVPCNTMEKFCPLPRSQRKAAQAPRPLGARAAGKQPGSARALAALLCTSSVFLAPAPPDCGPAHTIVKNKNPGGAPARGTRLPRSPGQGQPAAPGGAMEGTWRWWLFGTAWRCWKGQHAAGGLSSASTRGLLWWRAPLVPCSSVLCVPSTEGNKVVLLFIINIFFFLLILFYLSK